MAYILSIIFIHHYHAHTDHHHNCIVCVSGGFSLTLGLKDVTLVSQAAKDAEVPMPIASLLVDRFTSAKARGRGEFDWSAIGLSAAEDAGIDVTVDIKRNEDDIATKRTY